MSQIDSVKRVLNKCRREPTAGVPGAGEPCCLPARRLGARSEGAARHRCRPRRRPSARLPARHLSRSGDGDRRRGESRREREPGPARARAAGARRRRRPPLPARRACRC